MTRKLSSFAAMLLLCSAFALGACNTMRGAGQDVSSAGHAVSDAATQTQNDMQH